MNEYVFEYKDYYIQPHKEHPSSYVIVTAGKGGKIPNCLSGMYTTRTIAKVDIDLYLNSKPIKDKSDATTVNTGRSQ